MPTVAINTPYCRVHLKSERLIVSREDDLKLREVVLREVPLRDIDRVIAIGSVQFTAAALNRLLRENIPISLLDGRGRFLGGFMPAMNKHGLARLTQYRCCGDPNFTRKTAASLISAKLYNQRRILQRLLASRSAASGDPRSTVPGDDEAGAGIDWLGSLFSSIQKASTVDELRGYEGAATAKYFRIWSRFLPEEFPFERRSTRPPLNPVNAAISFGATVLYHEMVSFIHSHGLDPALGLLHTTENGRWSLALDLMEPFRPVLVEALTLDLFSRGMLRAENFEAKNDGVYLNEDGRRKLLLQYERRMERQFMSEAVGHRSTLRQQLENQAVLYKAGLADPERFNPFLMN